MKIHMGTDQDEEFYNALSTLSCLMLEATKIPMLGKTGDIGRALMDLDSKKFYRDIFVCGDKLLMEGGEPGNAQDTPSFKYGVRVEDFLGRKCPIREIQINYNLCSVHVNATGDASFTPQELAAMVHNTCHEEGYPPWEATKWDEFLGGMYKCKDSSPSTGYTQATKDLSPVFNPVDHVRFVFTHQVPGGAPINCQDDIVRSVEHLLTTGTSQMTGYLVAQHGGDDKLVTGVDGKLHDIPKLVKLEKIITGLQEQIFVCFVERTKLLTAKDMLSSWAGDIMNINVSYPAAAGPGAAIIEAIANAQAMSGR